MKFKIGIFVWLFLLIIFNQNILISQNKQNRKKPKQSSAVKVVKKEPYAGFQLPVYSEIQRDSIVVKTAGLVVFNSTSNKPQFYDGSIWINFTNERYIGEHYGGGIVFYIDETGKHGLIAAPSDQAEAIIWGNFKYAVESYETQMGIGKFNTKKIVSFSNQFDIAATICYNLSLNGYKDWYLPSKDEVYTMYHNLKALGIGKFSDELYWTSSETDFGNAWVYNFSTGFETEQGITKKARVRAIRNF
ncbi:MAG: DUF1566 domain-containing protein [Saprospiraceae bacterium]|nr:DUF1566 domain-containing protein [Saprospiraceae bacterium]